MREILPNYLNKYLSANQTNYITYFINYYRVRADILSDNTHFCLIKKNGQDAGFFKYKIEKEHIYFSQIHILKKFQRKGILTFIINYLVNIAKKHNFKLIATYILTYDLETIEIFKKKGFIQCDTKTKYIGDDNLFYEYEFRYPIIDDAIKNNDDAKYRYSTRIEPYEQKTIDEFNELVRFFDLENILDEDFAKNSSKVSKEKFLNILGCAVVHGRITPANGAKYAQLRRKFDKILEIKDSKGDKAQQAVNAIVNMELDKFAPQPHRPARPYWKDGHVVEYWKNN